MCRMCFNMVYSNLGWPNKFAYCVTVYILYVVELIDTVVAMVISEIVTTFSIAILINKATMEMANLPK